MKINFQNKKKLQIMLFVMIAVITLGVGYAAISAINLVINGNATGSVNQENFKVKFTTAAVTTGTGTAGIDTNDPKIATFDVTGLTKVGDTAVATYTVLNDSSGIGARIGLKVTNSNSEYFSVTEAIGDTELQAGDTTTATVTVTMLKTPIESAVSTSITGTLTASPLENAQATGTAGAFKTAGDPESFSTDSWATIKKAVQDNNTSAYNVGDTKEVTINNVDYTVRLANKTTGEHCGDNDTAYSQTACGFVVEFVDIITTMKMQNSATNVGGYPATLVFDYLNNTLPSQLPPELQSAIKPTRVISGHGNKDSANFTSTSQKLYLLSGVEVHGADKYDTAASTTTQLDYYVGMTGETGDCDWYPGCTTTYYNRAIKQYNGSNNGWWLRPAYSGSYSYFRYVNDSGYLDSDDASRSSYGVAPAFRIG